MFDSMKEAGMLGVLEATASAQGASPDVLTTARILFQASKSGVSAIVDQYTAGQPVKIEEVAILVDHQAAAFRLVADACDRAAATMRGNPGTLGHVRTGPLVEAVFKRSF